VDRNFIRNFVFPPKESVPRQNNRRAIVIHFALTVIGIVIFVLLQFLLIEFLPLLAGIDSIVFDELPMQLALLVTLVGGSVLYVACGYLFLKPADEKAHLSVFWLTRLLTIVGALFIGTGIVAWLGELLGVGTFEGLVGVTFALFLFLNTMGIGVMVFFGNLLESLGGLGSLVTFILLPVSIFLPPGLLYVGLLLKAQKLRAKEN